MSKKPILNFTSYKFIFWDFDGVIKDSVNIKKKAFGALFSEFGSDISNRVMLHHIQNGGISRSQKIPLYLTWAGLKPTKELIETYSRRFSVIVKQAVIESEWVPGVFKYLEKNHKRQIFFLLTATPDYEINEILTKLNIKDFFSRVYGSNTSKEKAIAVELENYSAKPKDAVMIGDAISDFQAAKSNKIDFVLRNTSYNRELQLNCNCRKINNFL